jgi:N-carbamoyl-L-amino-acid hydrolase
MRDAFASVPDMKRLEADLACLWTFTDADQPGFTRCSFTPVYETARRWLGQKMEAAQLNVRLDAAGNLIGRRPGREALPPLMVGSHTDTVAGGGRFDGAIGVIGGLELVRCLNDLDVDFRHPLELVDFLAEEPNDFGISAVGSRGLVGGLAAEMLAQKHKNGLTLQQAIAHMGGRPAALVDEARGVGSVAAYLELHVEQGPVLDREGISVAAVTGIVGIRRYRLAIQGRPDHAGTTPMESRLDALVPAAQFVIDVEAMCRAQAGLVGTVGHLKVSPNMANVVPGQVELTVDIRSLDAASIGRMGQNLEQLARHIGDTRGVGVTLELLTDTAPVHVQKRILEIIQEACRETTSRSLSLPSGAGHDASQIARIAPIGMIFVPSRGGRSHCSEEWTDIQDVALGIQVLTRALVKLDRAI